MYTFLCTLILSQKVAQNALGRMFLGLDLLVFKRIKNQELRHFFVGATFCKRIFISNFLDLDCIVFIL